MYKSPIELLCYDIQTQFEQKEENMVMEAIRNVGVNVDREELIKAMQYDREQYEKGYADAKSDFLDKIRAEIEELDEYYDNDYFSGNKDAMYKCNEVLQIIDKYKVESEDKE